MQHGCWHCSRVFERFRRGAIAVIVPLFLASSAWAEGTRLFSLERSTGEKPQSKLFHAGGSDWAVLNGPSGLALYERTGDLWIESTVLGGAGKADVKLCGDELYLLVFGAQPFLYCLDYDAVVDRWVTRPGFPLAVPKIHASETLVLERDSLGRLWYTAEGDGLIQVFYTVTTDPATWTGVPLVLESGVQDDDIASIVAFGGDKVGVFWSDQNRDGFGFRFHRDEDPLTEWSAREWIYPGPGHADDHLNLATDSRGRVFAITKDDFNRMSVHRRDVDGRWTTAEDVLDGTGNRGIIMVDEEDRHAFILYANTARSPATIDCRKGSLDDLVFGRARTFISAPLALDDVTGVKESLRPGSIVAMATTSDSTAWWNAVDPEDPTELTATVDPQGAEVVLRWDEPVLGSPDGYHVYRSEAGGTSHRLTLELLRAPFYVDLAPPEDVLCYRVTAVAGGRESSPSLQECADNAPLDPALRLRLRVGPNPFNPSTRIRFHLTRPQRVQISLYDVRGKHVATLIDGELPQGDQAVQWPGLDPNRRLVPAGTYFLALHAGQHVESRKITVLK